MGMLEVIKRTAVQAFVRGQMLSGYGSSDFFSQNSKVFIFC